MKRNLISIAALTLLSAYAVAQSPVKEMTLDVANGKVHTLISVDPAQLDIKSTQAAIITPMIITAGGDTISLGGETGIYGRRRIIHAERTGEKLPANALKAGETASNIVFDSFTDYSDAFNGARPAVQVDLYGCANCLKATNFYVGKTWEAPTFNYAEAITFEVPLSNVIKERAAEGRANVEFPVNRTELREDFRNNSAELAKVAKTIDQVKDDTDVTITAIHLKGFASPEGSWANNTRLAKGRTEALRNWIERRYNLDHNLLHSDYEPEDWEGLRLAVEADSTLPDRQALLHIITDTNLDPDTRDHKLRVSFPETYKRILADIYPSLRHTDYRVEYVVRSFTTPEEVFAVIEKDPSKLTASEFFLAAQSLDPADPRRDEILLMAAQYDPKSETANLNAASVALKNGDLAAADSYLQHAGSSAAAEYTRGLLAAAAEDYAAAERHIRNAIDAGYEPANNIIEQISILNKIKK